MSIYQTEVKILGVKLIKEYDCWYDGDIYDKHKVIETPLIWEGKLDHPPFEEGQYIYVDAINEEVKIDRIVRSTSNKYVYYTNHSTEEVIENELTKESYEKALAKSKVNKERVRKDEVEAREKKLKKEQEEQENKKSKFRKILDIIKS